MPFVPDLRYCISTHHEWNRWTTHSLPEKGDRSVSTDYPTPVPIATRPSPNDLLSAAQLRDQLRREHMLRVATADQLESVQCETARLRNEAAAIRRILVRACGGESAIPPGATNTDLASALATDYALAERRREQCHRRHRVAEQMIERLTVPDPDDTPVPYVLTDPED